ncbi:hypothetical protein BJX76DRAFT_358859 [Aspergillus varians]
MPMKWTPETDQLLLLKILETHELKVNTAKVAEAWSPGQNRPTPRAITERLVRMRQMVKSSSAQGTEGHFSIGSGASSTASTPRKRKNPSDASAPTTPITSTKRKPTETPSAASIPTTSGRRKRTETGMDMPSNSPLKSEIDIDVDADGEYELDDYVVRIENELSAKKRKGLFDISAFYNSSSSFSSSSLGMGIGQAQAQTPAQQEAQDQDQDKHEAQAPVQIGSTLGLKMDDQGLGGSGGLAKPDKARARRATVQPGLVSYADSLGDDEDGVGGRVDDVDSSASDYVPDAAGYDDDDFP